MNEWLKNFLTLGMTKEQAAGFTRGSYRLAMLTSVVVAYGTFLGFDQLGFAWAGDVKMQFEQKESAVTKELASVKAEVANTSRLLNRQLAAGIASQIRAAAVKRCPPAKTTEREAANREIDRLQEEFRELNGRDYVIPECGVL